MMAMALQLSELLPVEGSYKPLFHPVLKKLSTISK
jgi:hypothetical protein